MIDAATIRAATTHDFESVVRLLKTENLPVEDLLNDLPHFFVAEENNEIVAAIGLEKYGTDGLLRSMVVDTRYRGNSIAHDLIKVLLEHAAGYNIHTMYLITNTAERYFARKDFAVIPREHVPASIAGCKEFTTLCPSTAVVMKRKIL